MKTVIIEYAVINPVTLFNKIDNVIINVSNEREVKIYVD